MIVNFVINSLVKGFFIFVGDKINFWKFVDSVMRVFVMLIFVNCLL